MPDSGVHCASRPPSVVLLSALLRMEGYASSLSCWCISTGKELPSPRKMFLHAYGLSSIRQGSERHKQVWWTTLLKKKESSRACLPQVSSAVWILWVKAVISDSANAMGFSFYVCLGVLCLFVGGGCLFVGFYCLGGFLSGWVLLLFWELTVSWFKAQTWCLKLC